MMPQRSEPIIKDLMVRVERIEINGYDCLRTLRNARKIRNARVFIGCKDQRLSIWFGKIHSPYSIRFMKSHVG